MTSTPNHAADDGSLARSTGGAAARGALLISLAVIIGLVLLAFVLDDSGTNVATDDSGTSQPSDDTAVDGTTDTTDPAAVDNGDAASSTTAAPATIAPAPTGDPRDPAEVNVLVANGTGGKGVAGAVADKLKACGYIAEAANAPSTANSVIYYRDGYADDARAAADIIGTTPDVINVAPEAIAVSAAAIEDGRLAAANVVVIVGNDQKIPTG